jgi:tetratricopeptide (TPR) repeat protein
VLVDHPDSAALRSVEFDAVFQSGKKREAKKTRDRFAEDFPYLTNRIEIMNLQLDASAGKTRKVSKKLREYADSAYGPDNQKDLAIAHHRIDDLFRARRLMDEVHPEYPNDAELNAAMASNYFKLGRPATARKYARLALAADPSNRRMSLLIKSSWLMYFPPFYVMTIVFIISYGTDSLLGRIPAHIAAILTIFLLSDYTNIGYSFIIVLTGIEFGRFTMVFIVLYIVLYFSSVNAGVYETLFKRKKSVSLKKY